MSLRPASQRVGLLGGIGRACYRHRWLTLIAWIAGVACLITLWMRFGAAADNSLGGKRPRPVGAERAFPPQLRRPADAGDPQRSSSAGR